MTRVKLDKIYNAVTWKAADGSTWYKDLTGLHLAGTSGWAVGTAQVLRILDGGASLLNLAPRELSEGVTLPRRVFTIDQQTAWVITLSPGTGRKCFYTRDGGSQWREKSVPALLHPNDIFFFDHKLGWIISDDGDIPAAEPMIHVTDDGGRNWESHELEIKGRPRRLKFLNPREGLLIQHTASEDRTQTICNLLISSDGGLSWRVVKSFKRLISDFFAASKNNLVVVGDGGFISKSIDGGQSWKRSYTGSRDCLNVIEFNGNGRGIAAGDFGLVLLSEDWGKHWTKYEGHEELDNIVAVSFVRSDQAILATSRGLFSITFSGIHIR